MLPFFLIFEIFILIYQTASTYSAFVIEKVYVLIYVTSYFLKERKCTLVKIKRYIVESFQSYSTSVVLKLTNAVTLNTVPHVVKTPNIKLF